MVLYWGTRTKTDLYLAELAGRWQEQHSNFTFIPVLSEPLPEDHWQGRTGLVHEAVMQDFDNLSGYQIYACGAPVMVRAARQDFITLRNLIPGEFFSDAFTPSTLEPGKT
jgi:CDP-4-dehydro-6-deoxyglucose reductase, E3